MKAKVRFVLTAEIDDGTPAGMLDMVADDMSKHLAQTTFASPLVTAAWSLIKLESRTLASDLAEGRY